MKSKTVKETVTEHKEAALACKSAPELKTFIESIGCATKARWNKAVTAIKEVGGLDYYAARGEARASSASELRSQVTHETTLIIDAKARCQHFAICDERGSILWHGRFFDDDKSFSYGDRNEQSATECATARKAIWLASKIKEAVGALAFHLTLKVDAQWLCSLAGKAAILASDARRFNIDLNVEWIPGIENPADKWTTASGYKKWSENNLASLASKLISA
jgi:hypothetical protein